MNVQSLLRLVTLPLIAQKALSSETGNYSERKEKSLSGDLTKDPSLKRPSNTKLKSMCIEAVNKGVYIAAVRSPLHSDPNDSHAALLYGDVGPDGLTNGELSGMICAQPKVVQTETVPQICGQALAAEYANWKLSQVESNLTPVQIGHLDEVAKSESNPFYAFSTTVLDQSVNTQTKEEAYKTVIELADSCTDQNFDIKSVLKGNTKLPNTKALGFLDKNNRAIMYANPPLINAIFNQSPNIATALVSYHLDQKVSLNVKDYAGKNALHAATIVRENNLGQELIDLCLQGKIKASTTDKSGKNFLHYAFQAGNLNILKYAKDNLPQELFSKLVNQKDNNGKSTEDYAKMEQKEVEDFFKSFDLSFDAKKIAAIRKEQSSMLDIVRTEENQGSIPSEEL